MTVELLGRAVLLMGSFSSSRITAPSYPLGVAWENRNLSSELEARPLWQFVVLAMENSKEDQESLNIPALSGISTDPVPTNVEPAFHLPVRVFLDTGDANIKCFADT
jgi:hypothetical protein